MLHVNGVPMCVPCNEAVHRGTPKTFAKVSEALTQARREYYDALARRSESSSVLSSLDAGHSDRTAAVHAANPRLDAASLMFWQLFAQPNTSPIN
jgi:hypothetical protein